MISGQGPTIIAVSAAFLFINLLSIGTRFYTRSRISKNLNYNDAFIVIALLAYCSLFALLLLGTMDGIGSHTQTSTPKGIGNALKYIFFLEMIYVILTSFMKVSIAITLLQWTRAKIMIWLLRISIFLDFAISAAFVMYLLLQCQPISYAWRLVDPTVKGKCLPFSGQLYMGYALSFVTISLDMLFLFGPLFMLYGSGVNRRLKTYIYAIIGLGIVASAANFVRLVALVKLKASLDPLFDAAPVFVWSATEVSIGLVVAGIMELGPLLHKLGIKGFEDYSSFTTLEDNEMVPIKMKNDVGYDARSMN